MASRPGPADRERRDLADLLEEVGPRAPTLCEGWTAHDLAAHLVVRDRQPLAVPGMVVGGLPGRVRARYEAAARRRAYADLVADFRRGPALLHPFGFPPARDLLNVHELYIHHEDVRRANGLPRRALEPDLEDAVWRRTRLLAPLLLRRVRGLGVEIEAPRRRRITGMPGTPRVLLRGDVGELYVHLFNRRPASDVEVLGPRDAVQRLAATRLGP